jgi:large subunit ribosomal protein L22
MSFETRAVHRHARMGAYKARRILALIRGRTVSQALDDLRHDRHRAARYVYKVLASALANALQNPSVRANRLVVSRTFAQDGPMLAGGFRWRPGPQGRAMPVKKRTCHIHVHVADPQATGDSPAEPVESSASSSGAKE